MHLLKVGLYSVQSEQRLLIAIDFEKAFDTLNLNFLFRALNKVNFGPSFIHWIRVLYNIVSSCVMNNGFTTAPFTLGGGVRQGDPLSQYLCIIALKVLAERIKEVTAKYQGRNGEVVFICRRYDLFSKRKRFV